MAATIHRLQFSRASDDDAVTDILMHAVRCGTLIGPERQGRARLVFLLKRLSRFQNGFKLTVLDADA